MLVIIPLIESRAEPGPTGRSWAIDPAIAGDTVGGRNGPSPAWSGKARFWVMPGSACPGRMMSKPPALAQYATG